MENYLAKFHISKTNPARYLRRTLLDKGVKEKMIYILMSRHDINDLIGLIARTEKIEGYDFNGLFVKLADKELPMKKKKRQMVLPKIIRRRK